MKKSELKQLVRELIKEGKNYEDDLFKALLKVPEFKKLGMDRQGEIFGKITSLIMKG